MNTDTNRRKPEKVEANVEANVETDVEASITANLQADADAQAEADAEERPARRVSKKDQILSLYLSGMTEIEDLALITASRPSYIGSVLQGAGLKPSYFDLYTSTQQPMNVYSKFFANRLGFKDEQTAHRSVRVIDRLYRQFEMAKDRAGQHHALMMALTMFDRARWTGKSREAEIFRQWLSARLNQSQLEPIEEFE